MLHHVSLPAREPARVARVLAELLEGRIYPFGGPEFDSFLVVSRDPHGTAIEVYKEGLVLEPGEGDRQVRFTFLPPAERAALPFHLLLSVPVDRATIERIGEREGWRTRNFWRGSRQHPRDFELYELWLENRLMLELMTSEMVQTYLDHIHPDSLDARAAASE